MLQSIQLDNFKCIPNERKFALNKVNLFAGYNGRGKSSLLQAIMILSQSIKKDRLNSLEKIHLNGDFVALGDFDEILQNDHKDDFSIVLDLNVKDEVHQVRLKYGLADDMKVGKVCECFIDGNDFFDVAGDKNSDQTALKGQLKQLPPYLNALLGASNVHYVSANRCGPVKFVEKMEIPEVHKVGRNGNFTINTLSTYTERVSSKMNVNADDLKEYSLREAVTYWIDFIMSGGSVNVNASNLEKRSSTLSLDFNFEKNEQYTRAFQAYNVGFGYSYILSIVVTALIAKEGNIVIVENPEAHLHPKAQLNLAFLLAKLASNGVQVFIETHSEHIVNGFRIAALRDEYELTNADLNILFFDFDFNVYALEVKPNGKIPNWPNGFFDQYQQELAEILSLGRK